MGVVQPRERRAGMESICICLCDTKCGKKKLKKKLYKWKGNKLLFVPSVPEIVCFFSAREIKVVYQSKLIDGQDS